LNKLEYKKYSNNAYKCFIKNYKIEPVVINFLKYIKNNSIKNIKIKNDFKE